MIKYLVQNHAASYMGCPRQNTGVCVLLFPPTALPESDVFPFIRAACLFFKCFWGTHLKIHNVRLKKQNLCFAFFLAAWREHIFLGMFRSGWQSLILIHTLQAFLGTLLEMIFGIQKSVMPFYFSNPWDFRSWGSYFPVCPLVVAIYFLCIIFTI